MNFSFPPVDLDDPVDFSLLAYFEETIFPEDAMTDRKYWSSPDLRVHWIFVDDDRVGYLAVELDREPADNFELEPVKSPGTIYSIVIGILPEWRKKKIGKAAKTWMFSEASFAEGRTRIVSNVRVSNAESIALNRSCGFVEAKIIPGFYKDGEDSQVFIRTF